MALASRRGLSYYMGVLVMWKRNKSWVVMVIAISLYAMLTAPMDDVHSLLLGVGAIGSIAGIAMKSDLILHTSLASIMMVAFAIKSSHDSGAFLILEYVIGFLFMLVIFRNFDKSKSPEAF